MEQEVQNEALEAMKAGQHVGRKRKRVEVEVVQPPGANVIGNQHEIEESKEEAEEAQPSPPRRSRSPRKQSTTPSHRGKRSTTPYRREKHSTTPSRRQTKKTPSKSPLRTSTSGMTLRQGIRINSGEMTGSAELVNKTAKLSLT